MPGVCLLAQAGIPGTATVCIRCANLRYHSTLGELILLQNRESYIRNGGQIDDILPEKSPYILYCPTLAGISSVFASLGTFSNFSLYATDRNNLLPTVLKHF